MSERGERLIKQAHAIGASWCSDEGHEWETLTKDSPPRENVPRVVSAGAVRWCRNCGLTELEVEVDS